jgi:hypothetical protein
MILRIGALFIGVLAARALAANGATTSFDGAAFVSFS